MAKRKRKENIFQKEKAFAQQAEEFIENEENHSVEKLTEEFKNLHGNYTELIDQIVLITRISDRLQKKLDQTNEKLSELNSALEDKNIQLQNTIDDLVKARVGRRATTIVFIFALVLFVFSEALIEPYIDSYADNIYISLAIKAVIAMSIKPLEMLVENSMMKSARKRRLDQREAARQKSEQEKEA
jgi:hypothetical protein